MIGIYHGARIVRKVPIVVVIKFILNLKHLYAFFIFEKSFTRVFFFSLQFKLFFVSINIFVSFTF